MCVVVRLLVCVRVGASACMCDLDSLFVCVACMLGCLFVWLFVCVVDCLCVYLFDCSFACVCLFVCLPMWLRVRLFVYVCVFACLVECAFAVSFVCLC